MLLGRYFSKWALLVAVLLGTDPVRRFSTVINQLSWTTIRYSLASIMARWSCIVIWRELTAWISQAGQELSMSTWHSRMPPALIAWHYKLFLLLGWVSVEEKAVDARVHCFPQLVLVTLKCMCGQLIGWYQFGHTGGFKRFNGASIIINPRKHIWTYTAGIDAKVMANDSHGASATTGVLLKLHAAIVGQDYYCESALNRIEDIPVALFTDDPLWDRQHCTGLETSCCTDPNMPWFTKTLNKTTNEYIEVIVYGGQPERDASAVPLQLIELFIR